MDDYFEQKVAELTRAESQCAYLEAEYSMAQKALDTYGQESDFVFAVDLANLLLAAREEKSQLEDAIKEVKQELDRPGYEVVAYKLSPYSDFAYVMYHRYSPCAYRVGFGLIGFIAVCSIIGW